MVGQIFERTAVFLFFCITNQHTMENDIEMKHNGMRDITSLFNNMFDNCNRNVTWNELSAMVYGKALESDTAKYRYFNDNGLTDDAQKLKRAMPAFTPAVVCDGGRKPENFVGLTGVGMCDFDHVADTDKAMAAAAGDIHTMMAYRTISGKGVRILFRYEPAKGEEWPDNGDAKGMAEMYGRAFAEGNEYFAQLLGCEADGQCKNLGRLSVLCHDDMAVTELNCTPFTISRNNSDIEKNGKKTHGRRPKIGNAVDVIERKLDADGVRYTKGSYNRYVSRTGYYLNMLGIDEGEATEWAVSNFSDYDERDVRNIFKSCYSHSDEFGSLSINALKHSNDKGKRKRKADTRNGKPKADYASVGDIEDFLNNQAAFRFNIITRKIETNFNADGNGDGHFRELTDRDENTLWSRMCKNGIKVKSCDVHSVLGSEFVAEWNPFKEYFDNLPEWDGTTDYIGRLTEMVHIRKGDLWDDTDNPQGLFDMCFRKWLVAMVASLLDKDVVNNVIMVLIGRQGIYKTTFFNYLLPEELRPYFYTKTNSDTMTKDDRLSLAEYAIICLEEIDSMRTPELNQLKALVTTKTINERAAYSRYKENRAHIASFCGTGNNMQFLTDPTGNRRWLPFEADYIDDPRTVKYDYNGIYSQALALWRGGMAYWFNGSEINVLARHIKSFEVPNLEEELIVTYYRLPLKDEPYKLVNATNIIEHINIFIKRALSTIKVGVAMRKLGFKQKATSHGRMYMVVEREKV